MRRAYAPEQHLALLLEGLLKLQTKLNAGESVKIEVMMPDEAKKETSNRVQEDETSGLLNVEGGYTPGKYVLADRLVAGQVGGKRARRTQFQGGSND